MTSVFFGLLLSSAGQPPTAVGVVNRIRCGIKSLSSDVADISPLEGTATDFVFNAVAVGSSAAAAGDDDVDDANEGDGCGESGVADNVPGEVSNDDGVGTSRASQTRSDKIADECISR